MKHSILILLLASSALTYWACKTDPINCEGEELGSVSLDAVTLDYFPYKSTDKLIYRDTAGVEIVLTCTSPSDSKVPVNVEKLCENLNLSTYYKYYTGDFKRYVWRTQDLAYNLDFQVSTTNPVLKTASDTALIDVMSVVFFRLGSGASASIITSERGNSAKITDATRQDYSFNRIVGDTTINGKPLTGVFAGKVFGGAVSSDKSMVFVRKGAPAVAIVEDNGHTWVLDRVE
jgi:hypothetical protein